MNVHKVITIYNHTEQIINVQPTPEFDGCIEFWFTEIDGKSGASGTLYINKEELPEVIKMMQDMMDHVTKNSK